MGGKEVSHETLIVAWVTLGGGGSPPPSPHHESSHRHHHHHHRETHPHRHHHHHRDSPQYHHRRHHRHHHRGSQQNSQHHHHDHHKHSRHHHRHLHRQNFERNHHKDLQFSEGLVHSCRDYMSNNIDHPIYSQHSKDDNITSSKELSLKNVPPIDPTCGESFFTSRSPMSNIHDDNAPSPSLSKSSEEFNNKVLSHEVVEKSFAQLFDSLCGQAPDIQRVSKLEILSRMKDHENYESFINALSLLMPKETRKVGSDNFNVGIIDIMELLLDPNCSDCFSDGENSYDYFLELLLPHLNNFFNLVARLFSAPDEHAYSTKATILAILSHIYDYSGCHILSLQEILNSTRILILVKDHFLNGADEISIQYEMRADSELCSFGTLLNFLIFYGHSIYVYQRLSKLILAVKVRECSALSEYRMCNLFDIGELENEMTGFYEKFKVNSVYTLGTMTSKLSASEQDSSFMIQEVLPHLLSRVNHGPFVLNVEAMRVICVLGNENSFFHEIILETDVVSVISKFLREHKDIDQRREILLLLNGLFSNILCRNAFFTSGLMPDLVDCMRMIKWEGDLLSLRSLMPLVHAEWSSHSELISVLLKNILDKTLNATNRSACKDIFLCLAHGVGTADFIRAAFIEAECFQILLSNLEYTRDIYENNIHSKKKMAPGCVSSIMTFLHYISVLLAESSVFRDMLLENKSKGLNLLVDVIEIIPPPESSLSADQMEKVVNEIVEMKRSACHALEFLVHDETNLHNLLGSDLVPTLIEVIAPENSKAVQLGDSAVKRIVLELLYQFAMTDQSCDYLRQCNIKAKVEQYKRDENIASNILGSSLFNSKFVLEHGELPDVANLSDLELANSLIHRCDGGKWIDNIFRKINSLRSKALPSSHED